MNMRYISLSILTLLMACSQRLTPTGRPADMDDPILTVWQQQRQPNAAPPFFNQPAPSVAQTGYLANPNVQAFIRYQHQANGLDMQYLQDFFSRVGYRGNIIPMMNRPGTSRPWYEFRTGNAGSQKISGGRRFYQTHRAVIDQAAARYGVPAPLIVAILGIETNYGANKGNIPVAESLATLAFDYPRRGELFQKELGEFLLLAQEEKRDPMSFVGSFAGAMGLPQFMPSSFRKWAVDFDGDGRRDIWNNIPDTAASVANYMKQHGWQTGGKMLVPAQVAESPKIQALVDEKTALNYTVGQLRQWGVTPAEPVADSEKAFLFRLETAPGQFEYYLGLHNFYVVWQYNHSRMYVTAVQQIARGIGGNF